LKPEEADNLGLGIVLQPQVLPGSALSVDYYDIHINGAISSVDAQTEIDQCASGNTVFCSQVTRDASRYDYLVAMSPINFATQIARGIDFESSIVVLCSRAI